MFCLSMLPLSLVHSVIHTLLLALSASGRSVNGLELAQQTGTEFQCSVSIPDEWIVAQRALYHAIRAEALPETAPSPAAHTYFAIALREHCPNLLNDCSLAPVQAHKSVWQIQTVRSRDFLGAPAKDMLVRQNSGDNLTKIRKIFTVRKSHATAHIFVLSFSAPPNDYKRYKARLDALPALFVSLG